MNCERRKFIRTSLAASAVLSIPRAFAEDPGNPAAKSPTPPARVPQTHDPAVVAEFVSACHRDFDRVQAMVAQDPKLVLAARDTGNIGLGDWETGLNGAAHTGHRDIALFLLAHGARIDVFAAAMLGYREVVVGLLKADPQTATTKGPHNLNLLYHAAIGGDVVIAESIKPLLPPESSREYNSALTAAARDGRLEMTKWLLANGVTNVNQPDGFKKTPLKLAVEKKYTEVAAVLRENGGRE